MKWAPDDSAHCGWRVRLMDTEFGLDDLGHWFVYYTEKRFAIADVVQFVFEHDTDQYIIGIDCFKGADFLDAVNGVRFQKNGGIHFDLLFG